MIVYARDYRDSGYKTAYGLRSGRAVSVPVGATAAKRSQRATEIFTTPLV